jgi:hypothetical protein
MKYLILLSLIAFSVGCSNANPEVSFLNMPSNNSVTPASANSFVQGDEAAASSLTAPGYTASVMVHAGNNSRVATSTDGNYTLQIRKLSY